MLPVTRLDWNGKPSMNDSDRCRAAADRRYAVYSRQVAQVGACFTALLALLALVGWVSGRMLLAQWHRAYIPMAPTTALALVLLAAGVLACVRRPGSMLVRASHAPRRRCRMAGIAGLMAAGLAGLLLAGMAWGFNEAVEHLLVNSPLRVGEIEAGHMSPLMAVMLLLAGVSLALPAFSSRASRASRASSAPDAAGAPGATGALLTTVSAMLAIAVLAIAGVVLLGYLYGTPLLYYGTIVPPALPGAVAALLVGMALLAAAGPRAWPVRRFTGSSVGARMARALLPVMLGVIAVSRGVADAMHDGGVNPLLREVIETLVPVLALGAVALLIAQRIGRDIDRDHAALRSSEDRFRLFYENLPVPFHSLDGDGRLVDVNQAWLDTLGYGREEVVGRSLGDVMTEEGREVFRERFPEVKRRGFIRQFDAVLLRKDGSAVNIMLSARVSRSADGVFLKDYCVWNDTTERYQAQMALKQAKAAADEANRAKDRLLSTVSHELRTPLTPVLMTLSMMEADPQTPANPEDISMMRSRIELEARLIDGLLDLTRMTRGALPLKPQHADAHLLLEQALAMAVADADACHPAIRRQLDATDHFIWVDPARFQQVCWNILRNALQYTPDSGTIRIRSRNTRAPGDGPVLELEIADTGAGINPDFLPRVFNEFERGRQVSQHQSGGLGLGLSIAKTLIEQLGGTISAASDGPGKGASFTVRLPAVPHASLQLPADILVPEFAPSRRERVRRCGLPGSPVGGVPSLPGSRVCC